MYYPKSIKHYKYVLRIFFIAIVVLFILAVTGCEKGDTDAEGIMPSDIVSAEFTQPKAPAEAGKTDGNKDKGSGTATGDDFSIMLWAGALILAAAAGGTVTAFRKKNAGRSR